MKKIFSLLLAVMMLVSALPVAYATNPAADGTVVSYTSPNVEAWTITVPAALAPGAEGQVTLAGKWPSNKTIVVTADETVTLTSNINAADTKTLDIDFDGGISAAGDNEAEQTIEQAISVAAMPADAIFGIWSGTFYYNVDADIKSVTADWVAGSYTDSSYLGIYDDMTVWVWANFDIYREDGTLFFATFEPTPITD